MNPTTDEIYPAPEGQATRFVDIHVYDLPASMEAPPIVESEAVPADARDNEPDMKALGQSPRFRGVRRRVGIASLVGGVIALILLTVFVIVPFFSASAIVTIIPAQATVTTTANVTIAGRALATVTLTEERTAPATRTGYQDAQAAHGAVTFYNAAPFVQAVAAGTLLTGSDGVQVVTGQDAVIPAATMPTEGQATVSAYAVQPGIAGNIRAGDIYGACCRVNVFAANGVFTGGQTARSFKTVTQSDINNVVTSLQNTITQSIDAAFQVQLQQDEASTPRNCTIKTVSDHQAGAEAAEVHAAITAACTAQAYKMQDVQAQAMQRLTFTAIRQAGNGYRITGDPYITVTGASPHGSALRLQVRAQATLEYQLDQGELEAIRNRIAGMDKAQAIAWLDSQPGIHAVSVSISGSNSQTLPRTASAIRCTVLM